MEFSISSMLRCVLVICLIFIRTFFQVLEWQPEDVTASGGKAVFDFISAAVSTVHYCLSLLKQQPQQQVSNQRNTGPPSPVAINSHYNQTSQQMLSQGCQQTLSATQRAIPRNVNNNNGNDVTSNRYSNNALNGVICQSIPPPSHTASKYKVRYLAQSFRREMSKTPR